MFGTVIICSPASPKLKSKIINRIMLDIAYLYEQMIWSLYFFPLYQGISAKKTAFITLDNAIYLFKIRYSWFMAYFFLLITITLCHTSWLTSLNTTEYQKQTFIFRKVLLHFFLIFNFFKTCSTNSRFKNGGRSDEPHNAEITSLALGFQLRSCC